MFFKTEDGSFLDESGKILYFSSERFIKDICEGECCFICGINRSKTSFNDEHILPKWILRKYNLFDQSIRLPNKTEFKYGRYTIPCCQQCNSLMGRKIEEPIRDLINNGFDAVAQHLKTKGPWLFFVWLALIFLKTHLKDKFLKFHRDKRKEDYKIFDIYDCTELHHIHCVARSFYTNCQIDPKIMGSFLTISAKVDKHHQNFDYLDLYDSRTLLLRLDDICFITVLNDSCGSLVKFNNFLERLSDPMSPLQLREVTAHLAFINLKLKERPKFMTIVNLMQEKCLMLAQCPNFVQLDNYEESEFGEILDFCCKDFLSVCIDKNIDEIKEQLKQGKLTFLFDEMGLFNTNSFIPISKADS